MKDTHVSALTNAGVDLSAIDLIDFYSCFPIAVEMACEMLGLSVDDPRGFTVTGGLPYAGGPASAYTLHSLAEMTKRLRSGGGETGLVTGNGWYLTKHSAAVLSVSPADDVPPEEQLIDPLPSAEMETAPCVVDPEATGRATVSAYTVSFDREGAPVRGIVLGETSDGRRFLSNTPADTAFLQAFVEGEQVGSSGTVSVVDGKSLFDPG